MDTEGTSRVVTNLIDAGALMVFVPLVVVAVLLSGPVARRLHTSRALAILILVSIAGILAVTVRERDLQLAFSDVGAVIGCSGCRHLDWLTDATLWSRASRVDAAWMLNVLLFVPTGVFLTLATRRPWRVLLTLIGLSLLIELVQDIGFLGSPDPADLIANSLGAAIGVAVGAGLLALTTVVRPGGATGPRSRRSMLIAVAAVAALFGLGWVAVQTGADRRQEALQHELRTAYAGTTAADVATRLSSDAGFTEMLAAVPTRPTYLGQVGDTDQYEGRYTVQFFGAYRCVYIRWTSDGFNLRDGSGDECTVFRERPPSD